MGNTIAYFKKEEKEDLERLSKINQNLSDLEKKKKILSEINQNLINLIEDDLLDQAREEYNKEKKDILKDLIFIHSRCIFVEYLCKNLHKLFKKSENNSDNWIFCIDDESDYYFDDILRFLKNVINDNPDDVKSFGYYDLVNDGDFITLKNDNNYRGFYTLFLKKENGVIKAYFSEDAWGDDEFKTSGESNLPRVFLNESKEFPIDKWDILYHGSWANLSVKYLKSLNSQYFSNIKDIIDNKSNNFSEDTLNITMLTLDWGIFLFNKSKKDLFKYINDPDHADYIIGFGDQWMNCIPDVWMDYIKETKQQFAVSLAWDE